MLFWSLNLFHSRSHIQARNLTNTQKTRHWLCAGSITLTDRTILQCHTALSFCLVFGLRKLPYRRIALICMSQFYNQSTHGTYDPSLRCLSRHTIPLTSPSRLKALREVKHSTVLHRAAMAETIGWAHNRPTWSEPLWTENSLNRRGLVSSRAPFIIGQHHNNPTTEPLASIAQHSWCIGTLPRMHVMIFTGCCPRHGSKKRDSELIWHRLPRQIMTKWRASTVMDPCSPSSPT